MCKVLEDMRNEAAKSAVEQSRAWANFALFASCGCGALEIEYYIRDG